MKTSARGIKFIEKNEGLRLKAYKDSGGRWTIGVGHMNKFVHKGMVISKERAEDLLRSDLVHAEQAVNDYVTQEINQAQFDALVDFTFNLGRGALHGSSLLRYLNRGDIDRAANEFHKWMHVNGKENAGVKARRLRDRELFLS